MSITRPKGRDGKYKSPFYQYDFQVGGVRFYGSTKCKTRRDAEQFEKNKRTEVEKAQDEQRELAKAPMKLGEACTRYYDEVGRFAETADDIWGYMGNITSLLGADAQLRTINSARISEGISRRRADTTGREESEHLIANGTVNRTFTEPLRRVLKRARTVWLEESLPQISWKDLLLPEPQERIREASDEEEAAIFDAIRDDYLPPIRFMLASGCRLEEVVGLTWDKVYWTAGAIEIVGKGRRGAASQKRLIPITQEIRDIIWPLRNHHPQAVFTYITQRRDAKRRIQRGDVVPITYQGLKSRWRRDRAKANVTDFRLHDLRHTALTRLVRETGNLKLAQKLAGHKDITTTARYAHASLDDLREGMERAASRKKSRNVEHAKRKAKNVKNNSG